MKKASLLFLGLVLSVLTFASGNNRFNELFGPLFHPASNVPPLVGPRQALDSLHRWNVIAINASGLDHTPVAPGENRVFGEQLGPGRSSRAMAIVHIAMFDALDAVVGGFTSYTGTDAGPGSISVGAAISQAARDTLAAMFPSQTQRSTPTWHKIWLPSETRSKEQTGSISGSARLQRSWPCVSMMARKSPSRALASIISRAICPDTGGRIQ
jgi:hypothetical protein